MAKAWRGEKDLPRVVASRNWTMKLVKVRASVYLHPDHFAVAMRYFLRAPFGGNAAGRSAPLGDRLVASRKRRKTSRPAPLPDKNAWQTVKSKYRHEHCEQEYPSLPVTVPAQFVDSQVTSKADKKKLKKRTRQLLDAESGSTDAVVERNVEPTGSHYLTTQALSLIHI